MDLFKLTGDARINKRCATEGCGGQPAWRLEVDGFGLDYCQGCGEKIYAQEPVPGRPVPHHGSGPDNQ
jgi:hypothetical protein